MFNTAFNTYILIQCIIFYQNYNYVIALVGPNVRRVNENEFPAVVSLMRLSNIANPAVEIHQKCTGTLVSRQDVLTAAHCLRTTFREGFKVVAGSRDLRQAVEFFPIFIWNYDNWYLFRFNNRTDLEHDIAFVKISANVPENIDFAPTGNLPNENLYGMHVDLVGWGRKENRTRIRILRTGTVRIMTYFECQTRYYMLSPYLEYIHERFLCSMIYPHILLTEGDSGGPVFFFGTLVAISKGVFPVGDAGPFQPNLMNLHMSLRYYRPFFNDILTTFHLNL